ncbi:MAG TPA: XRE family transcriptional regulator [Treponemataceae bacterium]|nr:XRE family transcriptional regulator [Treponemataceae bacterium]HQC27403.1 XRE family transcriptional regulator [Treponemataceae bacterium]
MKGNGLSMEIAQRLKGLRDIMELSTEDVASVCGISQEEYEKYESGTVDIPVSILHSIATAYKFEITTLISGEEPRMHSYFLTKKDKGLGVDRRANYKYESLAHGFINRKADPYIVTLTPEQTREMHFNSHPGQEFNYMLEGSMKIVIDGKELVLDAGDSIYFDANKKHAMQALNEKNAKFLAIIF